MSVGVCSDLLQDLRLLLQAAVQVTASVHGEVLNHHLVDQFLQLTQLGAQMSEGRTNRHDVVKSFILYIELVCNPTLQVTSASSPEAVDPLQLLLQHLLGGGDELQRSDKLGGGQQQLNSGLRLMHRRHQLQLIVQLDAVVAGQCRAERPQGALTHDAIDGGGAAAQHGDGTLRLLKPVLQLVLRGHGVEEGL